MGLELFFKLAKSIENISLYNIVDKIIKFIDAVNKCLFFGWSKPWTSNLSSEAGIYEANFTIQSINFEIQNSSKQGKNLWIDCKRQSALPKYYWNINIRTKTQKK